MFLISSEYNYRVIMCKIPGIQTKFMPKDIISKKGVLVVRISTRGYILRGLRFIGFFLQCLRTKYKPKITSSDGLAAVASSEPSAGVLGVDGVSGPVRSNTWLGAWVP